MKRRNETYEYFTDRTVEKNVDFEQLLNDFQQQSKDKKRRKRNKNKRHK